MFGTMQLALSHAPEQRPGWRYKTRAMIRRRPCKKSVAVCNIALSGPHREVVDLVYYHKQSIEKVEKNHRSLAEHREDTPVLRAKTHPALLLESAVFCGCLALSSGG